MKTSAVALFTALFASTASMAEAFTMTPSVSKQKTPSQLQMGLDVVTGLRTEWISASICTNQIPSTAESVLQLGTDDGRVVNFVPRTVEEIITSSAEADGELTVSCKRQLKQQRERRGTGAIIRYVDQACDDLKETKDASIDVVISLQAAQRMKDNGQDWKKSIREASRVLKPGGCFLFVEQTEIDGEKFMDVLAAVADGETDEEGNVVTYPVFELVGVDDVDLVIVPHIAGVVQKNVYAGLTETEIQNKSAVDEKARMAELSISAFERGLKKRRKKKKKTGFEPEETEAK
jgi:ubiquinone/menaquinone biosynthesis C-methylase UbiE|eukprot:scaffold197_cov268-Chaetoceros_neogracile.AAC.60